MPKNVSEVRSFLGLCGYYRKFVPDYYSIAKPLYDLTRVPKRGRRSFQWSQECDEGFIKLKHALVTAPILGYPRDKGRYILDCDSSDHAMGAVLSQEQDGREVVLAYSSKALTKEQKNYCVTRKEFLAIVFHLKYFRNYLWGREILVRTDHGALQWYKNIKQPDFQLSSWIETVEEFGVKIVSRPGSKHQNADALSRIPVCDGKKCICGKCREYSSESVDAATNTGGFPNCVSTITGNTPCFVSTITIQADLSPSQISQAQKSDPGTAKLFELKSLGTVQPKYQEVSHLSDEAKCYWAEWDRMVLKNGILYRKWESPNGSDINWQIILPKQFRKQVLASIHEKSGHLGQRRCYIALRRRFFWYKFREELNRWISTCDMCQRNKNPPRYNKAKMQTYVTGTAMDRIAIDVCGPFPATDRGNVCCLVVGDYFTKWIEAYPLPNQEAETVSEILVREWICRFGVPKFIHSDQGTNFESRVFQKMCELLGIEKTRTTPGRPQSDGMVERFNRTMMNIVTSLVAKDQSDWDLHVQFAAMYYRATEHRATGETPNAMVFGRELTQPVDLQFRFLDEENRTQAPKYVGELQDRLIKTHQVMEQRLVRGAKVAKRYYDIKSNHGSYKRGDLVLLYDPTRKKGLKNKMRALWNGPFVVINFLSSVTYRIGSCRNPNKWKVVHFDKLRQYSPREPVDISWLENIPENTSVTEPPDDPQLNLELTDGEMQSDLPDVTPPPTLSTPTDSVTADDLAVSTTAAAGRDSPSTSAEVDISVQQQPLSPSRPNASPEVYSTPPRLPVPTGRRPARVRKQPRHLIDYDVEL